MFLSTKKFHLISKYNDYTVCDEKQNAPSNLYRSFTWY